MVTKKVLNATPWGAKERVRFVHPVGGRERVGEWGGVGRSQLSAVSRSDFLFNQPPRSPTACAAMRVETGKEEDVRNNTGSKASGVKYGIHTSTVLRSPYGSQSAEANDDEPQPWNVGLSQYP